MFKKFAVLAVTVCLTAAGTLADEECAGFAEGTEREHFGKMKKVFCDERDGQKYVYVDIGEQRWMAENLNYDTADGSGAWCYDNDPANCAIYGRLYNWNTAMNGASSSNKNPSGVRGVCPVGWHLPSDAEWDILIRHIDPSHTSGNHATAGNKLKSQSGWYNNGNGTDEFGFSALPGGDRWYGGTFYNVGYNGNWWSATEDVATDARYRGMNYGNDNVDSYWANKTNAFTVRCVMDDATSSINPRPSRSSASQSAASVASVVVRGRMLNVSSPNNSPLSIRMIDMRGKTVARFVGATVPGRPLSFSLADIPAGRYFVEVRNGVRRERASVVVGGR